MQTITQALQGLTIGQPQAFQNLSAIPLLLRDAPQANYITLSKAIEDGFASISVIEDESEKKKDKVFSQIPESGTIYTKSSEIIIKISKGIKVQDVIGMDKEDAMVKLQDLGFTVKTTPDDPEITGKVINQIPEPGTYLNYGSTVTIEIEP